MIEYEHQYNQITIFSQDAITKFCNTEIIKKEIDKKAFYKLVYVSIRSDISTYYYETEYDMQNEIENMKLQYNHGAYITYYRIATDSKWIHQETIVFNGERPNDE